MRRRDFERLVAKAIDSLPGFFIELIEKNNVGIVVEDEPSDETLEEMGLNPEEDTLFGLYQGIPLTRRTSSYGLVLPDKISIFQYPIEDECDTREQMIAEIQRTVVHEIAHHFGIGEDRLRELGY